MKLSDQQKQFLKNVDAYNTRFNAVRIGDSTESLYHCFWNFDEIIKAEEIKSEWDIPKQLVPFYGDWHDLLCLDISNDSSKIFFLNDNRKVVHQWNSISSFQDSLLKMTEDPEDDDLGVVEKNSWLNI